MKMKMPVLRWEEMQARKVFEEKYTAEKNFEILMKIYQEVIDKRNM